MFKNYRKGYAYYNANECYDMCILNKGKDNKWLLKIYKDNEKLRYAFWAMCNQKNNRNYLVSSRNYEYAKSLCLEMWKRPKSLESRNKMSESKKGKKINSQQQGELNHNFNKKWIT